MQYVQNEVNVMVMSKVQLIAASYKEYIKNNAV